MVLKPVARTVVEPETSIFWDSDVGCSVEVTKLEESWFLVRASKSYRLLKQDEQSRRETWSRNLSKVNDYLKNNFPNFQISMDYVDSVATEATRSKQKAAESLNQSNYLLDRQKELEAEVNQLQTSVEHGFDSLKESLDNQLDQKLEELDRVESELDRVVEELERRKSEIGEWEKNGVLTAFLFTYSTDPEVCHGDSLQEVVVDQLEMVRDAPGYQVKQKLERGEFKVYVEELTHPRVFNRLEHSMLLNPENINHLIESHPRLEDQLKKLRNQSTQQFEAYATTDLTTENGTFEKQDLTPARAINSILKNLDTQHLTTPDQKSQLPESGPFVGTLPGTKQVVAFDPAETQNGPHWYIAGRSGSGKTHLKRVLLENCASLGYNILAINPESNQNLWLPLANDTHPDAKGLNADTYWIDSPHALDRPNALEDLFTGVNAVTLKNVSNSDTQEFVNEVFQELAELKQQDQALFVFLDEAQEFASGTAAEAIQKIAQQGRKFGIHLVLASQQPKAFAYNYMEVRKNTTYLLLQRNYNQDFIQNTGIEDKTQLDGLEQGEVVIANSMALPEIKVDVRDTLTRLDEGEPSDSEIETIDSLFQTESFDFESSISESKPQSGKPVSDEHHPLNEDPELEEDQEILLEYIRSYIENKDERPSKSKCWRPDNAPFGSSKTERLLRELEEIGVIKSGTAERYGNEATVYGVD